MPFYCQKSSSWPGEIHIHKGNSLPSVKSHMFRVAASSPNRVQCGCLASCGLLCSEKDPIFTVLDLLRATSSFLFLLYLKSGTLLIFSRHLKLFPSTAAVLYSMFTSGFKDTFQPLCWKCGFLAFTIRKLLLNLNISIDLVRPLPASTFPSSLSSG